MASVMKFSCVLIVFALLVSISSAFRPTLLRRRIGRGCNLNAECGNGNYIDYCMIPPPVGYSEIMGYRGRCLISVYM